ncbi:MAG: GCN5-related N-acetyltransferase [Herbinix sp.]|jgi:predicted N-acetyltransferase YhbS|nr:GCN5-related N-acetyltransferase [Herbinix sp.]
MNYSIRKINTEEYKDVRILDKNSFGMNERGSNADVHEVFADNIRKSPYFISELDLVAVDEDGLILGHAIFSALPMGDNSNHVVWLNSLAIRHDISDNHITMQYKYQRKGIGTALVKHGLEIAKKLGYSACMCCGNPQVYQSKMGFHNYLELGLKKDNSVDDPDTCIFATELIEDGFKETNKKLSYKYYNFMA